MTMTQNAAFCSHWPQLMPCPHHPTLVNANYDLTFTKKKKKKRKERETYTLPLSFLSVSHRPIRNSHVHLHLAKWKIIIKKKKKKKKKIEYQKYPNPLIINTEIPILNSPPLPKQIALTPISSPISVPRFRHVRRIGFFHSLHMDLRQQLVHSHCSLRRPQPCDRHHCYCIQLRRPSRTYSTPSFRP